MLKKMGGTLKNLKIKRLRAYGAATIVVLGGAMSTGVEGKDIYIPTRYDNIGLGELVSVYKGAYLRAGFRFKRQATELFPNAAGGEGIRETKLYFEFSVPKFPNNPGTVYVEIDSPISEEQSCEPCSVTKGWDLGALKLHGAEYSLFVGKMEPADKRAISEIENKLIKFDTNRAERKRYQDLQRSNKPPGVH
jgi:hypothetical protein